MKKIILIFLVLLMAVSNLNAQSKKWQATAGVGVDVSYVDVSIGRYLSKYGEIEIQFRQQLRNTDLEQMSLMINWVKNLTKDKVRKLPINTELILGIGGTKNKYEETIMDTEGNHQAFAFNGGVRVNYNIKDNFGVFIAPNAIWIGFGKLKANVTLGAKYKF